MVRTTCPYCGVGCGIVATPDGRGGAEIAGDPEHPANRGRLCSKGAALGETLSLEDRLLHPEIDGRRVSWETALDTVADGFRDVIAEHGPDAVAFYVSGQLLTEDYYAANKLIKGFLGTANIDTNSRLCMASSVAGHKRAFGSDTVPGLYEDFELADLVVLVGSNLAWCHPVLFQRLEAAKRARPGDAHRGDRSAPHRHLRDRRPASGAARPAATSRCSTRLLAELHAAASRRSSIVERHTAGLEEALIAARATDRRAVRPAAGRRRDLLRLVRRDREDGHALFAGREPVERRRRQGQRHHQLPSADRPHRPAGHGAVLDHRPAQRHGRPRGRRALQHAGRAHGLRRRPTSIASAASGAPRHGDAARAEGGRAVRRGEGRPRSRRSGSWRPTRSPACPTPTPCARR